MDELENNLKFKEELLVRWHTQFAENQRIREQSFLKILGFLGAVVLGYTYVYRNIPKELNLVAVGSISLVFFASWQIVTIAYNFRRDQYVNSRIRREAEIVGKGKVFPLEFDPSYSLLKNEPKRYYSWIPDFLLPYYVVFPFFQLLLIISFIYRLKLIESTIFVKHLTIFILIIIFVATLLLPACYFKKLIQKYINYESENKLS